MKAFKEHLSQSDPCGCIWLTSSEEIGSDHSLEGLGLRDCIDKTENKIFQIYKEIQNREDAKS
jgi:hypothetical protein